MPAVGSSGLPFLLRRPDTGKFAYQRDLAPLLAPFVEGEIRLDWKGSVTRLEPGRRTIKISLSTGDETMARARWLILHTQVEALLQLAQVEAKTKAQRDRTRAHVDTISPEAISTIAKQAKHDGLAADDEAWIDPTFTTPLAGIVVGLIRKQAVGANARQTAAAARQFANGVIERETRAAMRDDDPGWLDMTITESEMPPDLFDRDGLRSGRVHALSPEQLEALAQAEITNVELSEIDRRLAENGLALPAGHPDRRRLALSLLRAETGAFDAIRRRERGDAIETPSRPTILNPDPAAKPEATAASTLTAMRESWLSNKRPGQKQADDNRLYVGYFVSLYGDLPVTDIRRPMIGEFLTLLDKCCRNVPGNVRTGGLKARVAWSERPENAAKPRLTRGTINAKALGSLSAALSEAKRLGFIAHNPCDGMALDVRKDAVVKRVPYTLHDLRRIFATSVYAQPAKIPKAGRGAAAFWLPLLGMFTGARLEELGQLLVSDAKATAAVPHLHITDLDDEHQGSDRARGRKAVKTPAARRRVPLHPMLVQLGFLSFVEQRKRRGLTRLFPELEPYRGRTTKDFSRWWGRWTDKNVTASPNKSFHSFRHLFIAKLRDARLPEVQIKSLVGHEQGDVTLGYGMEDGQSFSLEILLDAVETVQFPGLDLSHLRWAEPSA